MSLTDPSAPRPGRLVVTAFVAALCLIAAGICGWGWSGAGSDNSNAPHVIALVIGQFSAILLLVLTGFTLPMRWRSAKIAGPFSAVLASAALVAAGVGIATDRGFAPPS